MGPTFKREHSARVEGGREGVQWRHPVGHFNIHIPKIYTHTVDGLTPIWKLLLWPNIYEIVNWQVNVPFGRKCMFRHLRRNTKQRTKTGEKATFKLVFKMPISFLRETWRLLDAAAAAAPRFTFTWIGLRVRGGDSRRRRSSAAGKGH